MVGSLAWYFIFGKGWTVFCSVQSDAPGEEWATVRGSASIVLVITPRKVRNDQYPALSRHGRVVRRRAGRGRRQRSTPGPGDRRHRVGQRFRLSTRDNRGRGRGGQLRVHRDPPRLRGQGRRRRGPC